MSFIKTCFGLAVVTSLLGWVSTYYQTQMQARGDDTIYVVWSSKEPQGKIWEKLGKNGGVIVVPQAESPTESGMLARLTAPGFRSFGLNWKGWYPADAADDCSRFTHLHLKIRLLMNIAPRPDLSVRLVDNVGKDDTQSGNAVPIVAGGFAPRLDTNWRDVNIPLSRFSQYRNLRINRLWEIVFANDDIGEQLFQIDDISFVTQPIEPISPKLSPPMHDFNVGAKLPSAPAVSPLPNISKPVAIVDLQPKIQPPVEEKKPTKPAFDPNSYPARAAVSTDSAGWPIRDGIYGVADMPLDKRRTYSMPISRQGGNTTSRYNWRINADSGADDWYYKNRNKTASTRENAYWKLIEENATFGASSYICLPMLGWVAKDNFSHGYSVQKYGEQKASEPGHADIGNGVRADNSPITGNDPNDTSIQFGPEDVAAGVQVCVERANQLSRQGIKPSPRYWVLDNEPMLWHKTHRDVHPQPASYDELWNKTVAYAEAIRRVDPDGKIAGLCSWGWNDLFYSAQDQGYDHYYTHSDQLNHGAVPLAEWFLKKCAAYKATHGRALIDVLDVHWYPQAEIDGKSPYTGKSIALNEMRLRSTRDLWDADYIQESWVRNSGDRKPVALIPRMKSLIAQHCPGMELCLGEYNFGGAENITGALAQTEIFGIFAREKLDLAFFWQQPEGSQWSAWELFRNYDGRGGRFGNRFIPVNCDQPKCALFAARRDSDGALTIVAVNKSLHFPGTLKLDLPGIKGTAQSWQFDDRSSGKVKELPVSIAVSEQLEIVLPAGSATMIVVK